MTRRLAVLCNPTSGGGRGQKALAKLRHVFASCGHEVRTELTESAENAAELARAAAANGEEVVALGGDGMVRIVAHAVRGTDAIMGILPGGRGNDFARALGIPRDPVAACDVLLHADVRPVDAGDVDGQTFVGIASIGLESEVTRIANRARFGGQAVYLGSTFLGLARWRPASYSIEIDGERHSFTGYLAAAANSGRFGGGMRLAPDARMDDGLLEVVVIEDSPRWRFIADTPKVFKGTHVHNPLVHVMQAREVRLDADRPFEVYADGDEIASTPAVVRALPAALRVRAPASPA